jgi:hypothetical protein
MQSRLEKLKREISNTFGRLERALRRKSKMPRASLVNPPTHPGDRAHQRLVGFAAVHNALHIRYGGGKMLNESSAVSEAQQNLIMKHADTRTFLNHYTYSGCSRRDARCSEVRCRGRLLSIHLLIRVIARTSTTHRHRYAERYERPRIQQVSDARDHPDE